MVLQTKLESEATEMEKINKDGSITLTSEDGKYSVNYVNKNGKYVDEWDTTDDDCDFHDYPYDPWDE